MDTKKLEGWYTADLLSEELGIKRSSTLNLVSKLKKENRLKKIGGRNQKRIYKITILPTKKTNGFYDIVNKYAKEKLVPSFNHYTYGNYTSEDAIIEGIKTKDTRVKESVMYLFNHVNNWKKLFGIGKKENIIPEIIDLYNKARKTFKCKKIPKRYLKWLITKIKNNY